MPLNILLADDSVPAQNMGKKILVDAGYQVLTVSNGLEALRKINDARPDIAILDIFMPGYSGLEICGKLRANAATADLPVVLTVGKLEPYRPEDGEHVHSNAVIVKPFAAAELVGAVRSLIGAPQVQPAPEPEFAPAISQPDDDDPFSFASSSPVFEGVASAAAEPVLYSSNTAVAEEVAGPESLVFNPDAKPSRFTSSIADLVPSTPVATGRVASVFDDFDLGSHTASIAEPQSAVAVEIPEPVVEFPEPVVEPAEPVAQASEPVFEIGGAEYKNSQWTSEEPQVIVVDDLPQEGTSTQAVDPEPPVEQHAVVDPLLELSQAPEEKPGILESSVLEVGDAPEKILEDFAPEPVAPVEHEEEQLTDEEKARRQAFEELFNSTEVFPVEDFTGSASEPAFDSLLGAVDLPPIAAQPEPTAAEEVATVEESFERDPLLEDFTSQMTDIPAVEQMTQSLPAEEAHESAVMEPVAAVPGAPAEFAPVDDAALLDEIALPSEFGSHALHSVALDEPLIAPLETTAPLDLPALVIEDPPVIEHGIVPATSEFESIESLLESSPIAESAFETPLPIAVADAASEPAAEFAEPAPLEVPAAEVLADAVTYAAITYPVETGVATTEQDNSFAESVLADALAEQHRSMLAQVQQPAIEPESAPSLQELETLELGQTHAESYETEILSMEAPGAEAIAAEIQPVEPAPAVNDAERIHQAVERVFEKFKPLLVAAIVRELARND